MRTPFFMVFLGIITTLTISGPAIAQTNPSQAAPRKTIGIDDAGGNVQAYAARLRLTRGTWDYLKLTLRDTFKKWDYQGQGSKGFNALLDPGYDEVTHTAGPIRTTPFVWDYGRYERVDRPTDDGSCGSWGSCNRHDYNCGTRCNMPGWAGAGWTQVRKPGYAWDDTPYNTWQCDQWRGFQEYGFYLPAVGSQGAAGPCPVAAVTFDFKEFQACSSAYQYDKGSGQSNSTGGLQCETPGLFGLLDYNARIFIYPNMRQENEAADPVDGWLPPIARGSYTGTPWNQSRVYTTETNCGNGSACPTNGTCCTCWCWACGSNTNYSATCRPKTNRDYWSFRNALPANSGAYNSNSSYDYNYGTYFRAGDDTALYLNIYQMQIQSLDRPLTYRPPTCGRGRIYSGVTGAGAQPTYFTAAQDTRNCMRPKMYWDLSWPASEGGPKWRQCDPFDTWNTDGTLNPANDDDKWIYPGAPNDGTVNGAGGTFISPMRCRAQPCTGASCSKIGGDANRGYNAGSRTTDLQDIFRETGNGWYGLKLDAITLNPGTNQIDIQFSGKDIRLEMAAEVDVDVWLLGQNNNNIVQGRLLVDSLVVNASLRLYSIDDASCDNAYPGSCSGFWQGLNDQLMMNGASGSNPDKLVIDTVINSVTITPGNGGNWFQGSNNCFLTWPIIGGCVVWMADILNNSLVRGQLIGPIQDAILGALGGALGDISSAVPNLNGILGNPINMKTALIDSGIFMAGEAGAQAYQLVNPPALYPRKWPVKINEGPNAPNQRLVDMRLAVGFKPIAFRQPSGANNVLDVDQAEPPAITSVYGVPELWKPATRLAVLTAGTFCPTSSAGDTCPGGVFTPGPGCSLPAHFAMKDTDQIHDNADYCRGRKGINTDAFYYDPKTLVKTNVSYPNVIPDYWKGPISKFAKPPAWCLVVGTSNAPRTLRTGATPANLKTLYPAYPDVGAPWLSFDSALDLNPAGVATAQNTIGTWDRMPANSVYLQNSNVSTVAQPNGVLDPAVIPYDFSMHIHQRAFVEFAQAAFAAGVGCLEFGAQDTSGADAPWKSLFAVERFAAFIPGIQTLFPHGYAKMRIMPLQTPRIRVGVGNLSFTPLSRVKSAANGAMPIVNQPYTLSMALPDLQVQFLVDTDPKDLGNPAKEVKLLTLKWNTVLGFYAKAVRKCYNLDPLYTDPQCTSPFTNVRTVSGYYELFFDLNGQSLDATGKKSGTNMLGMAWEAPANLKDGFAAGRFSNESFACPGCVAPNVAVPSGQAMFEITQSYCNDTPKKCKVLALAQTVPALLSSTLQMFLVSRLNFYNLTIDFLYIGPDGPNNDGLGTAQAAPFDHINGDYLGIYARFLGNLNVFGLLDTAAMLAPKDGGLQAQALVKEAVDGQFVRTGDPEFAIQLTPSKMTGNLESAVSYSYSVDDGFWHSPVDFASLQLSGLTEGEHKLQLRTFEDTTVGATTNLTPTVFRFAVDTVPPEIEIMPSEDGYFKHVVRVKATDIQTPTEKLKTEFSWDDTKNWQEVSGPSISVRQLKPGRHVLRLQSTDLAGNIGTAAREVVVNAKGWGCSSAGNGDVSPLLILLSLIGLAYRGRRRA